MLMLPDGAFRPSPLTQWLGGGPKLSPAASLPLAVARFSSRSHSHVTGRGAAASAPSAADVDPAPAIAVLRWLAAMREGTFSPARESGRSGDSRKLVLPRSTSSSREARTR